MRQIGQERFGGTAIRRLHNILYARNDINMFPERALGAVVKGVYLCTGFNCAVNNVYIGRNKNFIVKNAIKK